jgi:8-oxo-dGTP pyrophosphatase MutT (NUDIX family)
MIIKDTNYKPKKDIVACHIICADKVLFLLRNKNKPQGGTYGVPAGKVQKNELKIDAIIREIREETGIEVKNKDLDFQKTFKVSYKEYDFEFHLYHLYLKDKPKVHINEDEHTSYLWKTPSEAMKLPLIEDEDLVLMEIFNLSK